MGILGWVILGLIAGSIAKAVLPGDYPGGLVVATILGVVGAILGGFLAQTVFGIDTIDEFFDVTTWLTAIIGALIVTMIYGLVARPGRHPRTVASPSSPTAGSRPPNQTTTDRNASPQRHEKRQVTPAARAARGVRDRVMTQAERRTPSTGGVFISYRRQDAQHLAGRLYDRLRDHFGKDRVFIDVDSIEPGLDFGEAIDTAVRSCGVMLVLIGERWLTSTDQNGQRRLDNPDDYVRLEIEATLNKQIRVIPVLIEGATMPSSQDLPASLALLSRRNALEMSHTRFDDDAKRLIDTIQRVLNTTST
jgi:uncharacterized membrane protein YeaQ/YmgE (transglycosylase-associated protein family)